jgi:signal transduction histidine kinase
MKRFSLNKRLIAAVVLSQLLLAVGLVIVGTSFSHYYIRSAFDVYLEGRAQSIGALVYFPGTGKRGLQFNSSKVPPSPHDIHKDIFLVQSDHGDFEIHSPIYSPSLFDGIPADARYWNFTTHGEPYRAIILRNVDILDTKEDEPQPPPRLTVVYAAPTMDIPQRITALASAIAFTSLGLLIPTLLLAIWSIRRALTPLNDLAAAARSISVHSWQFKPAEEAKSTVELEPLIAAIEAVLAGLQLAFTQQREFLADAAHELKTSLAILKSTLQSLLDKRRDVDEYQRGLTLMSGDCDRLELLLTRMLRLARAEQRAADRTLRKLELVDLASTCEAAIERMATFAAARKIRIAFSSAQAVMIRADPADLELVWINLLENAVQYSPRGSKVEMHLKIEASNAVISVSDRGCGIPKSQLPRVFDRFYRADPSRSRATGGMGLGLAIAKSIVSSYQGRISAESEMGRGTRISVILNIDTAEASPSWLLSLDDPEHLVLDEPLLLRSQPEQYGDAEGEDESEFTL